VTPAPHKQAEVYPWCFNRQLFHLRRPFVWREMNTTVVVLWGNRHLYRSMFYLNKLCFSGWLSAQACTQVIQRLMSQAGRGIQRPSGRFPYTARGGPE